MGESGNDKLEQAAWRNVWLGLVGIIFCICGGVIAFLALGRSGGAVNNTIVQDSINTPVVTLPAITDGKDTETGLVAADGYLVVKSNCTSCHSAKLITQNRLSRDRWQKAIRWMQKNQNLGDLGENEKIILDYLEKNYGASGKGRRKALEKQKWYELE